MPLFVFLLTFAAFLPVLQNGLLNWDDEDTLLLNLNYRGLGWSQLRWMFTTFHMAFYGPLTWMTYGLDYILWGENPAGYHLTSLVLHALNAAIFYFLSLRLLSRTLSGSGGTANFALKMSAGVSAMLFAVHPLRVELVAGASARPHLLAGLFLLSSVLCYLRYATASDADRSRPSRLAASIGFYGLSLFALMGLGMTLPVVLLVLDVYPLRRLGGPSGWFGSAVWPVWREKLPFIVLALGAALIGGAAKQHAGALTPLAAYGVVDRLAQSFYGIAFYLWKSALPLNLSPLYELPVPFNPWDRPFVIGAAATLTVTTFLFLARRRWPAALAGWACYVILLLPVLGVAQSGPQLVADRYSYLSCLGWALLAGAGVLFGWRTRWRSWVVPVCAGVLVLLGNLTWRQAQVWHDSERLWTHVLATTPQNSIAHNNLGAVLYKRGELEEAMAHYRQALRIRPNNEDAHFNLGVVLAGYGELEEAMEHYRKAFQLRPDYADAHYNLGTALEQRGRSEEAMEEYRQAVRIDPAHELAHYNLGNALYVRGELEEAMIHYRQAVQLNPRNASAHNNLAGALYVRGALEEAMIHYRQALQLDPGKASAHNNLGAALAERGQLEEAMEHYRQALQLDPGSAKAHSNMGNALFERGQLDEAIQHYRQALQIDPDAPEAKLRLNQALSQQ